MQPQNVNVDMVLGNYDMLLSSDIWSKENNQAVQYHCYL